MIRDKMMRGKKRRAMSVCPLLCFMTLGFIFFYTLSTATWTPDSLLSNINRVTHKQATVDAENVHPSSPYNFRIFIFTYARPDGLNVTLRSVLDADYSKAGNSTVDLEVFMDFRRSQSSELKSLQDVTTSMLNDVVWPYGRFRVHRRCVNAGLRHSIMEAWYPTNDREVGAFFEDDVEVSPLWFSWTHDALTQYAPIENGAIQADPKFIGISLFRPVYDELSFRKCPVHNGNAPFLLQQPCSWGAVYLPAPWRAFRSFFDDAKERNVLVSMPTPMILANGKRAPTSNRWGYETSWKKYLIYHMYKNGQYMLYPNLPHRLVFSTSRLLKGEHLTPDKRYFVLPLVKKENLTEASTAKSVNELPKLHEMKVFDILFREVAGIQNLPNAKQNKN